jgi:hypothetical protein
LRRTFEAASALSSKAATNVVVYVGSPGDSRRQTLLFHLFSIRLAIFLLSPQSRMKNQST